MRGEAFGPCGDEPRKLPCILVITAERTIGGEPGRSKEDDSVANALASKAVERLEVLRQYPQWASVVALKELLVLVGKRGMPYLG